MMDELKMVAIGLCLFAIGVIWFVMKREGE